MVGLIDPFNYFTFGNSETNMSQDYLAQLNEPQRAAVEHTEGPLMIIAGAGSGKTRVLTYRIAHLMGLGVDPFNILALTFTNKAAREMKNRVEKIVGGTDARNLWMGTFHSVFARILRIESDRLGYPSNFTIYDTEDSRKLITNIIKELNLDTDLYKSKALQGRISSFKNSLITPEAYWNIPELIEYDASARRPETGKIYSTYVERCFRAGAMDFDDLLVKTNELLQRFPEVLAKYQNRFKYLMVDEYQDTNHAQYLIVKALASRFENLCVVGDDAQSIYAFRGANIKNILNFNRDYPDALALRLEQNYRSTKMIVGAANSIIKHNTDQLEKDVWTSNSEGEKISVYQAASDNQEGQYVAGNIWERQMRENTSLGNFAVLYRTNAQSRSIEDSLRKRNIPYRIYGGVSFYQRREVKDVLAYLRLTINHNDEEAYRRVINYPRRGIGNTTIEKLTVSANQFGCSLWDLTERIDAYPQVGLNSGVQRKLINFATMIQSFRIMAETNDAFTLASHIAQTTGILKDLNDDQTPEGISRAENIQELLNSIKEFTEERKSGPDELKRTDLSAFLEEVSLITDLDNDDPNDHNKVSLMTIHLAKGLEFPNVYIVGLEEDLFPSMMAVNSRSDLEEERRLFYVALTRAEKSATLTYSLQRYRWGKVIDNEPSRFLEEIEEKYLDWVIPAPRQNPPIPDKYRLNFGSSREGQKKKESPKPLGLKKSMKPLKQSESKPRSKTADSSSFEFNIALTEGMKIVHERFGQGTVMGLEGMGANQKAVVKFDRHGEKKLLLKFAKLKAL